MKIAQTTQDKEYLGVLNKVEKIILVNLITKKRVSFYK